MKQPKKLTRAQKEFLSKKSKNRIKVDEWMFVYENDEEICIVNKHTRANKIVPK